MISTITICLLFICMAFSQLISSPMNPLSKNLIFSQWGIADGLPQNTITAITQDSLGYIWIGTPNGLARFDGVQFTIFSQKNHPEMDDDHITCLYIDQLHRLWIGTEEGGLYSFNDGQFKHFSTENGLSNNHVRSITMDWQMNLWIGTDYGLCRFDGKKWKIYTTADGLLDNIITCLALDFYGQLWIGGFRAGLARYAENQFITYNYKDGLKNLSITTLQPDSVHLILAGTQEGVFKYNSEQDKFFRLKQAHRLPVTTMQYDQNHRLWLGTMTNGLQVKLKSQLKEVGGLESLLNTHITTVFFDSRDHPWIGTQTDGLIMMKNSRIYNINRKLGLPDKNIKAVLQDRSGKIWIATHNHGLAVMEEGRIVNVFNRNNGLSSNQVNCIYQDNENRIWLGMNDGHLYKIENGRLEKLMLQFNSGISAVLQNSEVDFWIGTNKGLYLFTERGTVSTSHLLDQEINVLYRSDDHTIYAGTSAGLYTQSNNTWDKISYVEISQIKSIHKDSAGNLWVGSDGNGLIHVQDSTVGQIGTADGLPSDHIFSILQDRNNRLWLSTLQGIISIHPNEVEAYLSGKKGFLPFRHFNEEDGMGSRQCSDNGQPAGWISDENVMFYPTTNGLSTLDSGILSFNEPVNSAILENVIVNGQVYNAPTIFSNLEASDNIEIAYTAIDFENPHKLRFRYRLHGYNAEYIYVNPDQPRKVQFINLSPGEYQFELAAINCDGFISKKPVEINLSVNSGLFNSRAILILVILILLSSSIGYPLYKYGKIGSQKKKYQTSALQQETVKEVLPLLIQSLEKEKIFLNADLNQQSLARHLKIHSNYLSRIINEHFKMNFNDLVNLYRIEYFKKTITDKTARGKPILQIMYDSGFNSKSVFNTAFKKHTGITPSQYRNKILGNNSRQS